MPLKQPSYLLDFLAPRLFRQTTFRKAPASVGRATRSGSSAAAAASRPEDGSLDSVGEEEERRSGWNVEVPVAGPSRWLEQPESKWAGNDDVGSRYAIGRRGETAGRASWLAAGPDADSKHKRGEDMTQPAHIPPLPSTPVVSNHLKQHPLYTPSSKTKATSRRARHAPACPGSPLPFTSHFINPNPPPASALFPLLQPGLTKSSGDLLIRYSQRVDDELTEAATRDLMGRMRIAPVSWMVNSKPLPQRRFPVDRRVGEGEPVESEQGFGSGDDPPDPGVRPGIPPPEVAVIPRKPLSPEMRKLRANSNIWARRMWPPIPPTSPPSPEDNDDPHTFLRRQHHFLIFLWPSRAAFIDALRKLESLPDVADRDRLSLLHLHLAYPTYTTPRRDLPPHLSPFIPSSSSETTLLTPLFQLLLHSPHLRPTRQTLHLLLLSTLLPSSPNPPDKTQRSQITSLLTLFRTQWGVTPGCEGWRHVTRYALHCEDKAWAREGWEGWWNERRRNERGNYRLWTEEGVLDGGSDEAFQGAEEIGSAVKEEDVVFRFRHRGRELMRWFGIIEALEEKGWVKRRTAGAYVEREGIGKDGWEWVREIIAGGSISTASHTS